MSKRLANKRSGFTLLETMVTTALLPILLGAVYMGFNVGLSYFSQNQALARVQQEAMVGMDAMVKELSSATVTGCQSSGGALWFPSASAANSTSGSVSVDPTTGMQLWQKWVGYLPDSTGTKLLRSEVPFISGPVVLSALDTAVPTPALGLFQSSSAQRVLSADLESFTAQVGVTSVSLKLVLSMNASSNQPTRFELDDEVHLIN